MTPWVRLWRDMPNDPKWRTIAKKSCRPVSDVVAVFITMITCADENGTLQGWNADDVASGLDLDPQHVAAIVAAMAGKVINGETLTGWEKRQPKREDGSAERAKAWRERRRTQANAEKRPDTDPETEEITITTSEQEPAREEVKADFSSIGVGLGGEWGTREPSPAAKLAVAKALKVADAEPVAEAFLAWPGSRRARNPDAMFRKAAPKIYARLPDDARKRCGSLEPEIVVRNVRPSPQLTAAMNRKMRLHA